MLTTRLDVARVRPARGAAACRLGPWKLVSRLGGGPLTEVFRVRPSNCSDDHPADYVMKTVRRGANEAQAAKLLAREAQIGRGVSHPHLAPVLSAELDEAPNYVVLPRLEGVSLAAALASRERLAAPEALWIARQVAEALRALHGRGWRHGDVKPGNIHVSPKGHATLLDLGFAQPTEGAASAQHEQPLFASFAYAAPEIFTRSNRVSSAADVYSLGVTLFEMLAGRTLFDQSDATDLALAHLQQIPPDIREFSPLLSPRIGWLLKRMLAKEPLRRPGADELISLLFELELETFEEREWPCRSRA